MTTESAGHPLLPALTQILCHRSDWTTWADLRIAARAEGLNPASWDRRSVAAAAEASKGSILSCGAGYKLATKASEKDILEAYRTNVRKALGSDRRARAIISFARHHGILRDHIDEAKVKAELELELGPPPQPVEPPAPPLAPPEPAPSGQLELL